MENNAHRFSSIPFGQETEGVVFRRSEGDSLSLGLLVTYLLLGLLTFIRVFWSQRSRLGDPQNVSIFLASLIFNDVLHAISTVVMLMEVSLTPCLSEICFYLMALWLGSRRCGVLLHLLVALESVLSLTRPQWAARLRSVHWSVPITLAVAVLCTLLYGMMAAAVGLGAVACGLALVIIASVTVLRTDEPMSRSTTIWQSRIVALAMLKFLLIHSPTFILECLILNSMNSGKPDLGYIEIYMSLMLKLNLCLIIDARLCYVVLKGPPGVEQHQQQQQLGFENPTFPTVPPSVNVITS